MQSAARAIARIAAQRQQPWPRLQQWTQVRLAPNPLLFVARPIYIYNGTKNGT